MPLGTRTAEGALAATALDSALGHKYPNVPPAKKAANVWWDAGARTHVALWFLTRAEALHDEAEEPFDRAATLAAYEEKLWTLYRGDRSLASRGSVISSVTGAQAFDTAFGELTRIAAELA